MKDRRVAPGLVVLLVAGAGHRHETGIGQARELPVDGAGAALGEADQLGALVAALGLAEQQPEDTGLDRCEERGNKAGV